MLTSARLPFSAPAREIVTQLPLPLASMAPPEAPESLAEPPPPAAVVLPEQVWDGLPPTGRRQVQMVFLRVFEEVVGDASRPD